MKTIQHGKCTCYLLGTIQGLTSERKTVKKAYVRTRPDTIALPISKEELKGLKSVVDKETDKTFLSNYEKLYAQRLAAFGEVQVPPPSLVEAYECAIEDGVKIEALDMDDERYADTFCKNISTISLIRHGQRFKRLQTRRFKAKTARDFVYEWDATINKLKGFRNLETSREIYMAERLRILMKRHRRILALIELQRVEGVYQELARMLDVSKG